MLAQAKVLVRTTRAAGVRQDALRHRFALGVFWSVVGAVVGRGLGLVTAVIVGRLLGPREFGELALLQSTLGAVGVFAGAGLGLTVTKHVAEYRLRDTRRCEAYASLSLSVAVLTGGLMAVVLFLIAPWLASTVIHAPRLELQLRLGAMLLIAATINGVQLGTVAGLERFRLMAVMMGGRALLGLGLTGGGALLGGLFGAVAGMTLGEAVSVLFNAALCRRACRDEGIRLRPRRRHREEIGPLVRFAIPALLASVVVNPGIWISNLILVKQPHGFAAMGMYVAADKWRLALSFVPASMTGVVLPVLANLHGGQNARGFRRVFVTNLVLQLAALFLPGAAIILLAPRAMSLYGAAYASGWPILIVLCLSAIPWTLNDVYGQVLQSQGLQWWRFLIDALLSGLLVALALLLVPRYRAEGLAIANLLASAAIIPPLILLGKHSMRPERMTDGSNAL